ncbi:MAG: NAD-dependent succinate-semialdehyde dehydrogenase [Candidatus Hadarchaeum sp.]
MLYVPLFINGKLQESLKTKQLINPANYDEIIGVAYLGSREDAKAAIEAAYKAFPSWSRTNSFERSELLKKAATLIRERREELSRYLTLETGKPLKDALKEVDFAARVIEYYAEEAIRINGEIVSSILANVRCLVIRQPIGVAGLIVPWNFPVDLLAWKLGAALAAGCTVVVKPSSEAPIASTEFAITVHRAGFPPGVINVVPGLAAEVGAELIENPRVAKISFTGDTETGKIVLEQSAKQLKRVSLELGGNAPAIICDDANIELAIAGCVRRAFSNMGQICISINRVYVYRKIAEKFINGVIEATSKLKIGNGLDPKVDLGPMFREELREKTRRHIKDAVAKGAEVLFGGSEPEGAEFEKGYFFLPTILTNVNHNMIIMRDETFGPVMPIMVVDGDDEAIQLANDSRYGLAAYVYTQNISRAIKMAEALEAGGVGININDVSELQAPFGGWKMSGIGRELSPHAIDGYTEYKTVRIAVS